MDRTARYIVTVRMVERVTYTRAGVNARQRGSVLSVRSVTVGYTLILSSNITFVALKSFISEF